MPDRSVTASPGHATAEAAPAHDAAPGTGGQPEVTGFYDPPSGSVQYLVACPSTGRAAIIDPVLDFDPNAARTGTDNADAILEQVRRRGLTVEWVLDTHPHADHFSAAQYLARELNAPTAIGAEVVRVQQLWQEIYNWPELATDGRQWDRLWQDGDRFTIGELPVTVWHSPGHTLASITYIVGDAAFVHDTLFQPDFGTARADFPGADAAELYRSIQRILSLPEQTRIFTGHDYRPGGREAAWDSTVGQQRRENPHLKHRPSEAEFVQMRQTRDRELPLPARMLAALQVNLRAGRLPDPEDNGQRYLKIPLDQF
jgi:glyoxylase-like metal-dependent hydrolase (beta-lactamase superfamily II)